MTRQWGLRHWHHIALVVPLGTAGQTPLGRWTPVPVPPLPASLLTPLHVHVLLPRPPAHPEPRGGQTVKHFSMAQTRGSTGAVFS